MPYFDINYKLISKPKVCEQYWDDMTPADGGRVCQKCDKYLYDFQKMNWNDIKKIHLESNSPVCGMYSDKQLKYWGQEVPSLLPKPSRILLLLSSLFLFQNRVVGQDKDNVNKNILIKDSSYKNQFDGTIEKHRFVDLTILGMVIADNNLGKDVRIEFPDFNIVKQVSTNKDFKFKIRLENYQLLKYSILQIKFNNPYSEDIYKNYELNSIITDSLKTDFNLDIFGIVLMKKIPRIYDYSGGDDDSIGFGPTPKPVPFYTKIWRWIKGIFN